MGMRRVTSPSCSDEPGELIVTDKSGDIYRVRHDGGEIDRNVGQSNFLERRCAAFVEEQVINPGTAAQRAPIRLPIMVKTRRSTMRPQRRQL